MTYAWMVLAAAAIGAIGMRVGRAVRADGYGMRPPAAPNDWQVGDLPSTPYRDNPPGAPR